MAATRNLAKRLLADWPILGAALVTVTLALVLLASGPMYSDAVTLSAAQRKLSDASIHEKAIEITQRVPAEHHHTVDSVVTAATVTPDGVDIDVWRQIESESFELPGQRSADAVDITLFQHLAEVEEHSTLLVGSWPTTGAVPTETALSAPAAADLGLDVGDDLDVVSRRDRSVVVSIRVAGIFEITDPTDPYWFEDGLLISGREDSAGFRTWGPFLVDQATMLEDIRPDQVKVVWRAVPDFATLTTARVPGLLSHVSAMERELDTALQSLRDQGLQGASDFEVRTGLDVLLAETGRSLTVTRSSVLALLVQLAILSGYALALTAGLIVAARRRETDLVRSRGAAPAQIVGAAGLEAIVLIGPAAVTAPWLASRALTGLNSFGPLASIGLSIEPRVSGEAYITVAIAAIAAAMGLMWPAYRASVSSGGSSRRARREPTRSTAQSAGLDLALLLLAVAALWQLRAVGPEISARVQGRFGVDPTLVAAPALGLLAGAFLALRVVPLLARVGERIASAGRALVPALSAWQVARRPVRYSRSALLLVMAIGIGFFTAAYVTTWATSQQDQAAFQVGADIRLRPNQRTGDSMTDLHLAAGHEDLEGVKASMAVSRLRGSLPGLEDPAQFLLLEAGRAEDIVAIREDLAPGFTELMGQLREGRPRLAAVSLPGEPHGVGVLLDVTEEEVAIDGRTAAGPGFRANMSLVIQDDTGLLHEIELGALPVNSGPVRLEADLTTAWEDGTTSAPTFPLRVVDIVVSSVLPEPPVRSVILDLISIEARQRSGGWTAVPIETSPSEWVVDQTISPGSVTAATIAKRPQAVSDRLRLIVESGASFVDSPVEMSIRPVGTDLPDSFPIVVTRSTLEQSSLEIGETLRLPSLRIGNDRARIVGAVDSFPTVERGSGEVVLIDLPTIQIMGYELGRVPRRIDEYWLATADDVAGVVSSLESHPFESVEVLSLEDRSERLSTDPEALGTIGALVLGFVAASIFAAIGFSVSATMSARERMTEFALLRAMGLTPRQLGAWLSAEQGVLVGVSLLLGTILGMVLTATILPLVTLTQAGTAAVPEAVVVVPWAIVIGLDAAVLGVLTVIVVIMSAVFRRLGVGSLLRLGED